MPVVQKNLGVAMKMAARSELVKLHCEAGLLFLRDKRAAPFHADAGVRIDFLSFADGGLHVLLWVFLERIQAGRGDFDFESKHPDFREQIVFRGGFVGCGVLRVRRSEAARRANDGRQCDGEDGEFANRVHNGSEFQFYNNHAGESVSTFPHPFWFCNHSQKSEIRNKHESEKGNMQNRRSRLGLKQRQKDSGKKQEHGTEEIAPFFIFLPLFCCLRFDCIFKSASADVRRRGETVPRVFVAGPLSARLSAPSPLRCTGSAFPHFGFRISAEGGPSSPFQSPSVQLACWRAEQMPSVYIKTYGCQMNERDSEQVALIHLTTVSFDID